MKIRGSSIFLMVMMAVMILVISLSLRMEELESKLMPLVVCGFVLILAAFELAREIRSHVEFREAAKGGATAMGPIGESAGRRLYAGAWVVAFLLCIVLLGYIVAIPLFLYAYMSSHGTGRLMTVTLTIATVAAFYGVFELVLEVKLYRGLLFSYFL